LPLSDAQAAALATLVHEQPKRRQGLIFVSVAPFWSVKAGQTRFRLQARFVPWQKASRVLKLLEARG
jgi:hypothetical protein